MSTWTAVNNCHSSGEELADKKDNLDILDSEKFTLIYSSSDWDPWKDYEENCQ